MNKKVNQKENNTDVIIINDISKELLAQIDKELAIIQRDLNHVSNKKGVVISTIIAQAGYSTEDTFNFDQDGNLILAPKK